MNHKEQQERRENYRKHPIYGTDFSKRTSVLIEEVRDDIMQVRGKLSDIQSGTGWGERVEHVIGLLTCGLVTLAHSNEEIVKFEIASDDHERGPSFKFAPRGIGLDMCPGCFVCGVLDEGSFRAKAMMNNISGFVASREQGEAIAGWFKAGAWLDYREHEPTWLQVKIGACDKHLPNLQKLQELTSAYGVIRQADITDALDVKAETAQA